MAEQIAYAAGAARSILMDRHLDPEGMKDDDRYFYFCFSTPSEPPNPPLF